jgi:molecular chaperone DnaK
MKGDDKAQIEAKTRALEEASQQLFAASAQGAQAEAGTTGAAAAGDDVVDAEFTEVKDDKK